MKKGMAKKRIIAWGVPVCLLVAVCALGCAPASQSTADEPETQDAASTQQGEFVWSAESDCATCHADDVASFEDSACIASLHPASKDDCSSCHDDEAGMEKAHSKVQMGDTKTKAGLKRTKVDETMCLTCHDKDELAQTTADYTALGDKNGTVVNPHDLPANEEHQDVVCSSCHKFHEASEPSEAAMESCTNCHHAEVFECGTCH